MKITVWAISDDGNGFSHRVGDFEPEELENLTLRCSIWDRNTVFEFDVQFDIANGESDH